MIRIDNEGLETLTPNEVAARMMDHDWFAGGCREILAVSLECGCDLEITYLDDDGEEQTETVTAGDIAEAVQADWCVWGLDEEDENVCVVFA